MVGFEDSIPSMSGSSLSSSSSGRRTARKSTAAPLPTGAIALPDLPLRESVIVDQPVADVSQHAVQQLVKAIDEDLDGRVTLADLLVWWFAKRDSVSNLFSSALLGHVWALNLEESIKSPASSTLSLTRIMFTTRARCTSSCRTPCWSR